VGEGQLPGMSDIAPGMGEVGPGLRLGGALEACQG
jgi:hypothetical protein